MSPVGREGTSIWIVPNRLPRGILARISTKPSSCLHDGRVTAVSALNCVEEIVSTGTGEILDFAWRLGEEAEASDACSERAHRYDLLVILVKVTPTAQESAFSEVRLFERKGYRGWVLSHSLSFSYLAVTLHIEGDKLLVLHSSGAWVYSTEAIQSDTDTTPVELFRSYHVHASCSWKGEIAIVAENRLGLWDLRGLESNQLSPAASWTTTLQIGHERATCVRMNKRWIVVGFWDGSCRIFQRTNPGGSFELFGCDAPWEQPAPLESKDVKAMVQVALFDDPTGWNNTLVAASISSGRSLGPSVQIFDLDCEARLCGAFFEKQGSIRSLVSLPGWKNDIDQSLLICIDEDDVMRSIPWPKRTLELLVPILPNKDYRLLIFQNESGSMFLVRSGDLNSVWTMVVEWKSSVTVAEVPLSLLDDEAVVAAVDSIQFNDMCPQSIMNTTHAVLYLQSTSEIVVVDCNDKEDTFVGDLEARPQAFAVHQNYLFVILESTERSVSGSKLCVIDWHAKQAVGECVLLGDWSNLFETCRELIATEVVKSSKVLLVWISSTTLTAWPIDLDRGELCPLIRPLELSLGRLGLVRLLEAVEGIGGSFEVLLQHDNVNWNVDLATCFWRPWKGH